MVFKYSFLLLDNPIKYPNKNGTKSSMRINIKTTNNSPPPMLLNIIYLIKVPMYCSSSNSLNS